MDSPFSSRLDPGRALIALDRGWISPEQFRAILRCNPSDGSQLERLRQEGTLAAAQLAELYGSTVLLAPRSTIGRLGEAGIHEGASGEFLKVGDWIAARYRILEIFQGGFGRVYVCEAKTDEQYRRGDHLVALKTPLRRHLAGPDALELFYTEAAHWISLGPHPNLVLAYGLEEHQRLPFLVVEYIQGARSLHQEICAGRMNWLRGLWIALDVARGLAHAEQSLGLVHGDLKPLNLLITPKGSVKITDFGLSMLRRDQNQENGETLVGTLGYLAPEMYAGQTKRTTATDVYAFGVTIFETVTGHNPFPMDEPWLNVLLDPPNPRQSEPELPEAFAELILACLHREPEDRPASFQAITRRLERLHQTLTGNPPPPSPEPDAPAQADALTNLSHSWLNLGRLEEARDAAKRALRIAPDHWKAACALGNVRLKRGDALGAVDCFEAAHEYAPGEVIPLVNAALACHESGNEDRATHWLAEALQRCQARGAFAALDPVSRLLVDRLSEDEALGLLDRIVFEDPGAVITWNNRAVLLRRQGRPEEALVSADQALAINPIHAKAWSNRATILVELERFGDAIESSDQALALDPSLAGAYAAKATALAQLNRLPDAQACIQNGLRILPGHPLLQRAEAMFR